jgi:hypothetical protein
MAKKNLCDVSISNDDREKMLEKHVHSFRHELRYLQLEQGQKIYVADERVRRTNEIETLNNMAVEYIYLPIGQNKHLKWENLCKQLAVYEIAETDKEGNGEVAELEDNGEKDEAELEDGDDNLVVVKSC